MKRIISAINCSIENVPAPLFYKCRMFCVYNDENERIDYYENPYYKQPDGYEEKIVEWVVKQGVVEAYSMRFTPKVRDLLTSANIRIIELKNQDTTIEKLINGFNGSK